MKRPFDPYNVPFAGAKLDPYRVIELFRISHPAIQQAIKKLLRCGGKHKTTAQDVEDAITSLQRWQEMEEENRKLQHQPTIPGLLPGLDEMVSLTPFELQKLREFDERHGQRVNGHEPEEYIKGLFRCWLCGCPSERFTEKACPNARTYSAGPDLMRVE